MREAKKSALARIDIAKRDRARAGGNGKRQAAEIAAHHGRGPPARKRMPMGIIGDRRVQVERPLGAIGEAPPIEAALELREYGLGSLGRGAPICARSGPT